MYCIKNWIKYIRKQICLFVWVGTLKSLYFTYSHLLYHSLSFAITHCHFLLHLVTRFTTRCHSFCYSLSFIVLLVVISFHSFSFVVTRWTACCHLLSLDIPLVCLFINDLNKLSWFYQNFKINFLKADPQDLKR